MMPPSPRVLILAEAANPEWVSVPLVGWSHARALMDVCDAHLVTQIRNRNAILRTGLVEGRDFTAIDSEAIAAKAQILINLRRGAKSGTNWTTYTALLSLTYPYFERLVWKQFGKRIRNHEFDVVHRITPLSPTSPSPMARKCAHAGVPFVLGPLNGGVPWPKEFASARRQEKEWLSYVRSAYKLMPGYRSTRKYAAALLIASRDTWRQMPQKYHHKCLYLPENAIDPSTFQKRRCRTASVPIKAIFVGRLVPYKGADMLLEAACGLLRDDKMTLNIVGDGPQMPLLKEMVAREKLERAVTLSGWVEHAKMQDQLIEADVLAFPSIREFGGGVALEAMAVGVVPMVPRYGGLGELVTDETGFLIEMGSRQQIIDRYREALAEIAQNPDLIEQKSQAAYQEAHDRFTWSAKAQQTLSVYEWVSGRTSQRPPMDPPANKYSPSPCYEGVG